MPTPTPSRLTRPGTDFRSHRLFAIALGLALHVFLLAASAFGQAFTFTLSNLTYSENFDSMGSTSGTSAYVPGWTGVRGAGTGTVGAVLTPLLGNGSANSGGVYNVGVAGVGVVTDRALGALATGSTVSFFGASFTNNTGHTISSISLEGIIEQWRQGSSAAVLETETFSFSLDATDLLTGTWTTVSAFNLTEIAAQNLEFPTTGTGTNTLIDGNAPGNRAAITASSSLNWVNGSKIWIRWADTNDAGNDALLAIDDFKLTVQANTDTTTPSILIVPSTGSMTKSPVTVTFSLPETATQGSVKLSFVNGSDVKTLTLSGAQETAGDHTFNFVPVDPVGSSGGAVAATTGAIVDGTYQITLSYMNTAGNPAAADTVTSVVIDTTPPTIAPPTGNFTPLTVATGSGGTATLPNYVPQVITSDNLSNVTVTQSPLANASLSLGSTLVTLTAADQVGNIATISFNVSVQDGTAPNIAPPTGGFLPATLTTGINGTVSLPDYTSQALTSDNVAVTAVTQNPLPGSARSVGSTSVTITARDAAGNSQSTSFSVTVSDGTAPTVAAPGNNFTPLILTTGTGGTVALPNYTTQAVTSDNVAVTSVTQSPGAGSARSVGINTVTITAKDANQNTATLSFDVTVQDGTKPSIAAPSGGFTPLALNTGVDATASLPNYTSQAVTSDNVGVMGVTQSPLPGSACNAGVTSVTLTARDAAGNSQSISFNVTVNDGTVPTIAAPSGNFTPLTLTTGTGGTVALPNYTTQAVTSDNVGVTSVTQSPVSGNARSVGTTTVTLTARDAKQNIATVSFDVTIQDGTKPTIAAPSAGFTPLTLTTGVSGTALLPDFTGQAMTSDNVGVTGVIQSPLSGSTCNAGITAVTLTARDAVGNTQTTSFNVTVNDGTVPTINAPTGGFAPVTLSTGKAGTVALPNYATQAVTSDNVGVTSVAQSPVSGSARSFGTTTVTLTARDARQNFASFSFDLNVQDGTPPFISGPASGGYLPASVNTGANGHATLPDYTAQVVKNDNVGVTLVSQAPAAGADLLAGVTQITLTAHDAANNTSTTSFNLTVNDQTAPTVSPLAAQRLAAGTTGKATVPAFALQATDNVAVTSIVQTPLAGTVLPLGTYSVNFVVKDAAGNTTPSAATFTIAFAKPEDSQIKLGGEAGDAVTGLLAPGAGSASGLPGGTTMATFAAPAISDFHDLAAHATFKVGRTNIEGILAEDGAGTASVLAFQAQLAPDIEGARFQSFFDPVIAPDGTIAFAAKVRGGDATRREDEGVWQKAPGGALKLFLREGFDVPGLPANARLKSVTSLSLRDGELIGLLSLSPGTGGVTASNDEVLLRQTAVDTAKVLLREGDPLDGSTIKSFSVLNPALGSPGHGRWHAAQVVVAKVTLADKRIVLVQLPADGTPTKLFGTGPAPEIGQNAVWKNFGLPAIGGTEGNFAVLGTLQTGVGGVTARDATALLFSTDGSAFKVVARQGNLAPLSSAQPTSDDPQFASFFDPVVNDAGNLAFLATLRGTGVKPSNQTGLWWGTSQTPSLLARLGQPAPDADGNDSTAHWSAFVSYALPSGEGAGPILVAKVSGTGVNAKNRLGLWAVDSTGKLREILRTGVSLTAGGPTLSDLTQLGAVPGAYGVARSYNATGALAVLATFADKSQALLRIDLP